MQAGARTAECTRVTTDRTGARPRAVVAGPAGQRALRRRLRDRLAGTAAPGSAAVEARVADFTVAVVEVDQVDTAHPEGRDRLLTALGSRLVDATRPSDLVVRTPDRFVLVLDGSRSPQGLATARRRLADLLARPVLVDGRPVRSAIAVGLVPVTPADTVEGVLARLGAAVRGQQRPRRVPALRGHLPLA
jgi:GGDEF domain-containing protein